MCKEAANKDGIYAMSFCLHYAENGKKSFCFM